MKISFDCHWRAPDQNLQQSFADEMADIKNDLKSVSRFLYVNGIKINVNSETKVCVLCFICAVSVIKVKVSD